MIDTIKSTIKNLHELYSKDQKGVGGVMTDKVDKEKIEQTMHIPPTKEPSLYANSVLLNISYYDFEFKFGIGVGKGQHENLINIYMSPQHTKVLKMLLEKHIKTYEDKFGELTIPPDTVKKILGASDKQEGENKNGK